MTKPLVHFNTDVNIIASMPDYEVLAKALQVLSKQDMKEFEAGLVEKNEFSFRTENSRKRFLKAVQGSILKFENESHRSLVTSLFNKEGMALTKQFAIFWQMAINNDLFYALSEQLFLKLYFSGRVAVQKDEFDAFLFHLKENSQELKDWSDITIATVGSKYLTFLKKLDFLKGTQRKELVHLQSDRNTFIFFIYLMKALYPDTPNIYETGLFDFLFMSKEAFMERAKTAEYLHFYDFSYNGVELKLEPKFHPQEIVHVLSERKQTKI